MGKSTGIPDYETWLAEQDQWEANTAASLGMTVEERQYLGLCANAAGDDDGIAIQLAVDPILQSIAAEDMGAPKEDRDPAAWRRRAIAAHHADMAKRTRPPAKTPPRKPTTGTRARGARREHQTRTAKTSGSQDPGDPDPDPDPDELDPIQRRVDELLAVAPPFSPGQARLLTQLLGGA
jgi:hypothetical protein